MRLFRWQLTRADRPSSAAEATGGMADAIFGYGVILANAGLVTREQLGDGFAELVRQLESTDASESRMYLPRALRDLFRTPLVGERRFTVVAGDAEGGS